MSRHCRYSSSIMAAAAPWHPLLLLLPCYTNMIDGVATYATTKWRVQASTECCSVA
jgi:hypothetical protein